MFIMKSLGVIYVAAWNTVNIAAVKTNMPRMVSLNSDSFWFLVITVLMYVQGLQYSSSSEISAPHRKHVFMSFSLYLKRTPLF